MGIGVKSVERCSVTALSRKVLSAGSANQSQGRASGAGRFDWG